MRLRALEKDGELDTAAGNGTVQRVLENPQPAGQGGFLFLLTTQSLSKTLVRKPVAVEKSPVLFQRTPEYVYP
jgi:hypothetical protein